MNYKVAIVEDEKHQQDRLTSLLEKYPEFKIMGIAPTIDEAKKLLTSQTPDLVFMDVMLPPHTSFDLLKTFTHIPFEIIFTTSFEEYAVKAFRLAAIDYLLKPLVAEELASALSKFKQKNSLDNRTKHFQNFISNVQNAQVPRIALPTNTGYIYISPSEIVRCESDDSYSTFYTTDKRQLIISRSLKECEQILSDYHFYRIHNSHLINLKYISEYTKDDGGTVKMTDGSQIEISRRRRDEFLRHLKHF
ncbi:MAG TPA: DNA-binding response regulator [Cytophagales bacterium]|jgi:two-component system, LytTR family, response regulator|nr:DNA-binding response regulator [Cytophagales bacterium]